MNPAIPQILAPAGDTPSFLAALAAGADAVYCGLKRFSARMQAENFSVAELAALRGLAAGRGARTYLAFNTLLAPGEAEAAIRLLDRVTRAVRPDGLILQDLGAARLARQAGYEGELHLSTLANVSHPAALPMLRDLGISRVVLPRELNIDEVKAMAAACPEGLSLEVFVHGALCYAVSGRCYWSSYLGGKSGLRGRCVQPCRRRYVQGGRPARTFSCQDLSLDVLTRTLLAVPQISAWKIEGRKKGPHYVFHTVSAYRMLRDHGGDPQARKAAVDYLEQALGRPGTHYLFLPQKKRLAVSAQGETGSGLLAARVGKHDGKSVYIRPRFALQPGDLLRVGSEDDPWHQVVKVTRAVPKAGRFDLPVRPPVRPPEPGTNVLLIDRRDPELAARLRELDAALSAIGTRPTPQSSLAPRLPKALERKAKDRPRTMDVFRRLPTGRIAGEPALWLAPGLVREVNRTLVPKVWWWLPPVIWPDEEDAWRQAVTGLVRAGGRRLVLGAPWQAGLLEGVGHGREGRVSLWAGPFCNLANGLALEALAELGFSGAFASPELTGQDLLDLPRQSPLPLGVVESGLWPLCVSRTLAEEVRTGEPVKSPKGETAFAWRHGQNVWVYPGWPLDISARRPELEAAGYAVFARLHDKLPAQAAMLRKPSTFNWDLQLL